ncbi:hypothetical protein J7K86_01915 [bacterium]|nr:hypothetical protein [bacterium]
MSVVLINNYSFGEIIVNDKKYNQDIYIDTNGKINSWWRKKSHFIEMDDLENFTEQNPEILIIGTGAYGMAKISADIKNFCQNRKIKLIVEPTNRAIKEYNRFKNKKIMAYFHITC